MFEELNTAPAYYPPRTTKKQKLSKPFITTPFEADLTSQYGSKGHVDESGLRKDLGRNDLLETIKEELAVSVDNDHLELCLAYSCPTIPTLPDRPEWMIGKKGKPVGTRGSIKEESHYYKPFADFLSDCNRVTREAYFSKDNKFKVHQPAIESIFGKKFKWMAYNKIFTNQMKDTQKVDIVGCNFEKGAQPDPLCKKDAEEKGSEERDSKDKDSKEEDAKKKGPENGYVAWHSVVTFVEVKKSDWREMIAQASMYARLIFHYQPQRVSVRFVLFNCSSKSAVIGEIDHGGVYLTRKHCLRDKSQYERFCYLFAGMLCSSTEAHGYNRRIRIDEEEGFKGDIPSFSIWTNGAWHKADQVLCDRRGLMSRSTWALALSRLPKAFAGSDKNTGGGNNSRHDVYQNEDDNADEDYVLKGSGLKRAAIGDGCNTGEEYPLNPYIISTLPQVPVNPPLNLRAAPLPKPRSDTTSDKHNSDAPEDAQCRVKSDSTSGRLNSNAPVDAPCQNAPKKIAEVTVWNHSDHRRDSDRQIVQLVKGFLDLGYVPNGLAAFAKHEEARGTFLSQGPAKNCTAPEYYYTDSIPEKVCRIL